MLDILCDDIFCYLMSMLKFSDICNVSACCKKIHKRIYSSNIWKNKTLFVVTSTMVNCKSPLFMAHYEIGPKFDVSNVSLYSMSIIRTLCLHNKNVVNIPPIYKTICSECNKTINDDSGMCLKWKLSGNYSDFIHLDCIVDVRNLFVVHEVKQ